MSGDRIAAIDIGTNTVLFTAAERVASGGDIGSSLRVVEEGHAITRLGQGVDERRKLDPAAVSRTLACLTRYRHDIERLGVRQVKCVGTSALRDVADGDRFLAEAAAILDCRVEVISGAREAELTFRGACSALANDVDAAEADRDSEQESVLAFDIGGGSTEIVLGTRQGRVISAASVNVGSVRLFERHGQGQDEQAFALAESVVQNSMPLAFTGKAALVIGIAGTMTTLWSLVHGAPFTEGRAAQQTLSTDAIARAARELHAMPLEARRSTLGIHEGRADVIPFGALIATTVLRWARATEVRVTSRGVRYGLLLEG